MTAAAIEFIVLTGFLGSGKTTLLADFLKTPDAGDTAVIVNEVGEIGLDGALLREDGGDIAMAMLANGCICCRMGSDLAATVDALIEAKARDGDRPLRRVILETSGLSKPGPILRQLADLAHLRMRLAVIATYDALRGPDSSQYEEAAAQWAAASRIVLTKLDVVTPDRARAARQEAESLNPLAEIVALIDRPAAVQAAFAPIAGSARVPGPAASMSAAHPRIAAFLVRPVETPRYEQLATWLDNLGGALGDRLLRLKGVVRVAGLERPLLVQSVGTLFSEPRPFAAPGPDLPGFVVVIARDTARAELDSIEPQGCFRSS